MTLLRLHYTKQRARGTLMLYTRSASLRCGMRNHGLGAHSGAPPEAGASAWGYLSLSGILRRELKEQTKRKHELERGIIEGHRPPSPLNSAVTMIYNTN